MLADRSRRLQLCGPLLFGFLACGSAQDKFLAGRSDDPCNQATPVCNTVAGCILTDSSYTSGTFPGTGQFIVQTSGPASVELHFFLPDPTAGGTETVLTWYESGCNASFQQSVMGSTLIGEAQSIGEFVRAQQLSAPGDHLITYESDATSMYFLKVVVVPTN